MATFEKRDIHQGRIFGDGEGGGSGDEEVREVKPINPYLASGWKERCYQVNKNSTKHVILTMIYPVSYTITIISIVMKDLSTKVKRAVLVAGLMIVAILVCTPAGAGESGSDASSSAGIGLTFPLTQSLSLGLRLSFVNTGQVLPGETQPYAPPIPLPKEPGFDLRYSRVGVGLSFGF